MIALACFSFLCGAVLAQRFTVLILLPIIVLGWLAIAMLGFAADLGGWWIIVAMNVGATTLQLGYLAGILAIALVSRARTSRKPSETARKSRPQPI